LNTTLFDISPVLPPGFHYQKDFLTKEEESFLINSIQQYDLQSMKFHQYVAKRNVLSFGKGWSFTEQRLVEGKGIPSEFHFLIDKIAAQLKIRKEQIAQFLITEYPIGAVINWHRDAPPFDIIIGISLMADCNFKLRPHEKQKQTRSATINLEVQRRSIYYIKDEAKAEWQHCTAPTNHVRYSLTFRTLKNNL